MRRWGVASADLAFGNFEIQTFDGMSSRKSFGEIISYNCVAHGFVSGSELGESRCFRASSIALLSECEKNQDVLV